MIVRAKRPFFGLGHRLLLASGALLIAGSGVLMVLEWQRRQHLAVVGSQAFESSGTMLSAEQLTEKYRDPRVFDKLLAEVRQRYDALRQRFLDLTHTRKARLIELDRDGRQVAVMEITDRVQFEGTEERKIEMERRQLLGKPFPFDPDTLKADHPNRKAVHPFSNDTPPGTYQYSLEGVEELNDQRALRVHFEPTKPIERSFQGSAWIDADTREPIRIQGALVKTPLLVDRFEMRADYGLSENGHNQLRHVTMDVAGGFAFVSRHYRIESELSDYRMREK